ncbi:MAG: PorT family protein [Bacteroidaceae bacterium]|nr:PorT family protein [Bacteroidaceae bacterium]
MKKFFFLLLAIGLFVLPMSTNAQLKIGPKVGISMSSFDYSRSGGDISSKTGITAGILCEYISPWHGLGFDVALMYESRRANWEKDIDISYDNDKINVKNMEYINIPVNLKWKYSLPIIAVFATAGPQFSFLADKSIVSGRTTEIKRNSVEVGFNLGLGIELFKALQISAGHYWATNPILETSIGEWKARTWTVGAAYLF